MSEPIHLDDSIYNPYALEGFGDWQPSLITVYARWVRSAANFDEGPLLKLIAARGPEEVSRHRERGEAALNQLPSLIAVLDELISELNRSLAQTNPGSTAAERLKALIAAARHNRAEFKRAPVLVAEALATEESAAEDSADAEAAAKMAAQRMETLGKAAQQSGKTYTELRPLSEQLREAWAQLEAATSKLPREDGRRLRGIHEAAMRASARAVCISVLEAKKRARDAGELAPPTVALKGNGIMDRFAVAIIRRDYTAASALLAPWLHAIWTPAALQARIEEQYAGIVDDVGLPAGRISIPPADYEVSSNQLNLAELRRLRAASPEPIPAEITEQNFLGWVPLSIFPDEDDSYLSDVDWLLLAYLIPVRTSEGEQIGMLVIGEH